MEKIDIIQSDDEGKAALRPGELDKCWTQGECVRCGMCCITYVTEIPRRKPRDAVEEVRREVKDTMEPCKYLVEDDSGRFGCACHDVKDNPALSVCKEWKGDLRNGFSAMMLMYANNLVASATQEDIMVAEKLCRRGSIAELDVFNFSPGKVRDFLFQTLLCEKLPYALWDAMNLELYFLIMTRAEFKRLYVNEEEFFSLAPENPAHVAFAKRYLHFDLFDPASKFRTETAESDPLQSFLPRNEN
ncbi:hypothetical protein HY604_03265 [Candidatus Peregrinibacteria bacterium]|nr:hypothetical protein [Candidatus Peregrinibacteria bacterium]